MDTILYLGTEKGVVAVAQRNDTWTVESQGLKDWEVTETAVNAAAPNAVFAATRGDGVWRSEDFGRSWSKPSYGRRGPGKLQCLTLDPHNLRRLYAGGEPIDVFVSDDAGSSWQVMESIRDHPAVAGITYPVATVEPHVRDVAVDPTDGNKIYLALQVGYILKSFDGGRSWELLDQGFDSDVHTIAINPADTDRLLIATGGHDYRQGTSPGKALYSSHDGGKSWMPVATEFEQEYSIPMVLNPKDPNIAYSALAKGHSRLWSRPTGADAVIIRSTDGGETWQRLDHGLDQNGKGFAGAITMDAAEPRRVYAAFSTGQILASDDGGDSWTRLPIDVPGVNDIKCVVS